jgi:hypothetical protein
LCSDPARGSFTGSGAEFLAGFAAPLTSALRQSQAPSSPKATSLC